MPVPSSGQIRITDLVAEFGGTAPHSLSEYYRNAGLVPSNNTSIPTSGQFRMSNGYGAVNEIAVAATSSTNVDLSSLFGGNWTSTIPKRLTIASGVTIGGTGSSAAIIIPSNMAGTLTIDNSGSILGKGGAANSGAGGNAISNSASGVTINNTGYIAGGGGGGGLGGSGGSGGNGTSTVTTVSTRNSVYGGSTWRWTTGSWAGVGSWTHAGGSTSKSYGGHNFYRGSYAGSIGEAAYWTITGHINSTVSTSGGSGGGGGAGGVGRGYNQTHASGASGASGAAGGTNAGTGGTGGTGGSGSSYGTAGSSGSTGNTGANGNASNGSGGSGGSSGGAAGAAVTGTSVTMNNTGTLYGAVA